MAVVLCTLSVLLLPSRVRALTVPPSRLALRPNLWLSGAAADFVAESFGTSPAESADIERRIIRASPGPVAQLFRVAVAPADDVDDDDRALLEARRAEVAAELAARRDGLAALGLTPSELKRTVTRVPEVLAYSSARAAATAAALRARLALDDLEFKKKIVLRLPQALGLDYAAVGPELDALAAALDLADDELRKVVLGAPQILGLSYDDAVRPTVEALARDLGSAEAAKAEVLRRPAALDLDVRGSKRGAAPP